MLSIKQIKSLHQKKHRIESKMFIAEGIKTVCDIISLGNKPVALYYNNNHNLPSIIEQTGEAVSEAFLKKISCLTTPPPVFAVFNNLHRHQTTINEKIVLEMIKDHILFIDNISDPGNFGTIIRTADWFGFKNIVCSHGTVEVYNPKVIQATMGAIANINIYQVNSMEFLSMAKQQNINIYGTYMNGEDIKNIKFDTKSIFIIGNEANGITPQLDTFVSRRVGIHCYSNNNKVSESLNASVACSILCYELRR